VSVSPYLELVALCKRRGFVLGLGLERDGDSGPYDYVVKVWAGRPVQRHDVIGEASAGSDGGRLDDAAALVLRQLEMSGGAAA
jgi:hypothetical protein